MHSFEVFWTGQELPEAPLAVDFPPERDRHVLRRHSYQQRLFGG